MELVPQDHPLLPLQDESLEVLLGSHTSPLHQPSSESPSPPSHQRSWRKIKFATMVLVLTCDTTFTALVSFLRTLVTVHDREVISALRDMCTHG